VDAQNMGPLSRRVRILNGEFDALTLGETVDAAFAWLREGRRGWLSTVNVSTLMAMRRDDSLQSYVDRSTIAVADGQPLVWCARLSGERLPERVTGIDLVDALCARAAACGVNVFMLGSTEPLLARALAVLRRRHPGLRVAGLGGHYPETAAASRVAAINASGAAILLVGMGSPRQERFIDEHWERLRVGVAVGVGGSFDVIAGVRMRAPRWVGRLGLEWLVRLAQEPRRLLPRYVSANSRFCVLIAFELARSARRARSS
jgi:N-acetylglucosaminyldiphosphoundecaprenol N-acetyl-beta-D-mannosaminyltransferase